MSIENYRFDSEPRALYYADYRSTYDAVRSRIVPGQRIPSDLFVSFVGNNELLPASFDLRKVDRQPVGNFSIPGKSAHVTFTDSCELACEALFDRKARRTDHLYTVQASELEGLGFYPFYLPLPNLPLHLRVIHEAQQRNPEERDVPFRSREALATLLGQHQVC